MTSATSRLLNIKWVKPGAPTDPTVLAFTGFGHRLDPWMRLRPERWRVGVLEFPVGTPPSEVWTPEALTAQLPRYWGEAAHRALLSFSFGGAGASAVAEVLAKADKRLQPEFAAYVAPVQWARAPWSLFRSVPADKRLGLLKRLVNGGSKLVRPFAGQSVKQFVHIVENYVGWDFVAYYLPYIDWIDSTRQTTTKWSAHPWPSLLVGATGDRVIPNGSMARHASRVGIDYFDVTASHFNALDRAAAELRTRLAGVLTGSLAPR